MEVVLGSKDSIEMGAVHIAFSEYLGLKGVNGVPTKLGLSKTPENSEVFTAAHNRALLARQDYALEDPETYFVGLANGITRMHKSSWGFFASACIVGPNLGETYGASRLLPLQNSIIEDVLRGNRLADIVSKLAGGVEEKQKVAEIISDHKVLTMQLYQEAISAALLPYKSSFYTKNGKL